MIVTFVAPIADRPVGGVHMILEYAEALHRRGHTVRVVHADVLGRWGRREGEQASTLVRGCTSPGVEHLEVDSLDPAGLPDADVIMWWSPEIDAAPRVGLPAAFVQGYRMFPAEEEHRVFRLRCLKVCVAGWLVDVGVALGVPREQLVHVPLGLRHDRFPLLRPIDDRPRRVAFCHNSHPQKRAADGYAVLERVREALPDVEAVAFGTVRPRRSTLPPWVEFVHRPAPEVLVGDIYNGSAVFLCTSLVEGFGLTNIEAMSCGCALVTTDNGGARDYAVAGETALVAEPLDIDTLAAHVIALLEDPARRIALAEAGHRAVARFDWAATGARLEQALEAYLADPAAHGR